MTASLADIEKVLADMRNAIDSKQYTLINRKKNMDTLARLGITWHDAVAGIYTLTSADYYSGPEVDYDFALSDYLWVFKQYVFRYPIYIKFKVEYQKYGGIKILSFHIDNM